MRYLLTLCVRRACRGQSLSPRIYGAGDGVGAAGWPGDRGEGVDTVYYVH